MGANSVNVALGDTPLGTKASSAPAKVVVSLLFLSQLITGPAETICSRAADATNSTNVFLDIVDDCDRCAVA